MSGGIFVLLPAPLAHLASVVREAGCTPVIDATGAHVPAVPDGAWIRTRPGRPAPGTGPVILAELGAPIPDRPTWLESSAPRAVPAGYAGLVLKGREAGGLCGEDDGLLALSECPEPGRVLLDAGVGPDTAAAAAALGAAGVLLVEPHLGCPEIGLPAPLARRLALADDEISQVIGGLRVANSPIAPVLRDLVRGGSPWALADELYEQGPMKRLWFAGQGLALAAELAQRHGSLRNLLAAYVSAFTGWEDRVRAGVAASVAQVVHTASALGSAHAAAGVGGTVGSAVLWQEAAFLRRPVSGGSLVAALATGQPVVADADAIEAVKASLGPAPSRGVAPSKPAPSVAAPVAPAPVAAVPGPSPVGAAEPQARPAIAIIGIGCLLPGGATSAERFWDNIVGERSAIGTVPPDRWDVDLYFDEDHDAPDRTYTRIGGFLEDFEFEPKRFRIPPKVANQVDPVQQITLTAVADALADAGLQVDMRDKKGRAFDRARCAVILGNSLGGEVSDQYAVRLAWPAVERQLGAAPSFRSLPEAERVRVMGELEARFLEGLPEINEDSMPGELANVIAGRIANAFDLGGANYTVDAACASSMAAIDNACKALQNGEADLCITGGADRSMNVATYVKFCKIGALSPDHSAPFDDSANGFVMGEGAGIMVLKRYEDAVADGDRIYAVIRGIGASSDGKGKGITAPNIVGQIRALERAYEAAGFQPSEVDLVEAHGTSTVVGDKVEVEALSQVIGSGHRAARGPIRVGSVKSMIGHLKSAAGAASCIKAALALHHGVLPPSLGFRKGRTDVPFDTVPLQVQTHAEPWPATPDGIRRAGVSAFGFGGTNFHVVMESYSGRALPQSHPASPPVPQPPVQPARAQAPARPTPPVAPPSRHAPEAPVRFAAPPPPAPPAVRGPDLPEGIWATSGADTDELLANLKSLAAGRPAPFEPASPLRIAAAGDPEERAEQLDRAIKAVQKGSNPDMLRGRGVHLEDGPIDGKLAMLFTGQGSQYTDMGLDLAEAYPVVAETYAEADRIVAPTLGRGITDFIRCLPGEDRDAKEEVLKRTEYSQPATLTLDVAILRLFAAYGVQPDMVAGHSLGEYGAAVAAGILTFDQALLAVSARGREMANIRLDDPGKMAGIATNTETVEEVLAEVQGYVVAANKNCPSQTVIAGASDAVDEAVERFRARGITVHPLPVSHAFHSRIVAPASDPLRGVLARLGPAKPRRPISTNVTGDWYPEGTDEIVDILAQQISSPVEWVAQTERMYEAGARLFVECGPKRALAGFTVAILKRRPHRAMYTNHPKRGGVKSFRDALAGLLAAGLPVRAEPGSPDLFAAPEPRRSTTAAIAAGASSARVQPEIAVPTDITESILQIVADATGYETEEFDLDYELEADLGVDTVKQAEVFSQIRDTFQIPDDPDFDPSAHKTLRSLIDWAGSRIGATAYVRQPTEEVPLPLPVAPSAPAPAPARLAPVPAPAPAVPGTTPTLPTDVVLAFLESAAEAGLSGEGPESFARALLPAVQNLLSAAYEASQMNLAPFTRTLAEVVCSGASIGLPGGDGVFDEGNLVSILRGDNRIDHIGDRARLFLEKGIVRLVKDAQTGAGSFLPVEDVDQVIRLAGIRKDFDLAEWGADPGFVRALDITSQLAIAAGLEALRDAGIPLVRATRVSASGKTVPGPWQLPASLQNGTGVIFASAFPGYDQMVEKLASGGDDGEGRFDRRFLFQVLSMGHSQFAQMLGAKGPNSAVNAACASTTQAVAIAEDWIRLGRCERVVVIGADDVTSPELLPWIGSGFMAAGAATTKDRVEEAALPFDARRHGMILGMGAVGMVLERADLARGRGITPIATLVASRIVNSAFHGSRLDVDHIAGAMKDLVAESAKKEGITPAEMAKDAFFMSHETYTPARGGSAAAEIDSLRAAFGSAASEITIANTKGFTGHAMGAGIEDGVAVKALQYGIVPPLANLKVPDESLGSLRLSRGEFRDFKYGVRLAAGFGSQLALTVWRAEARNDDRVANPTARLAWLRSITGFDAVDEHVDQRTLRVKEGAADHVLPIKPAQSPADLLRPGSKKAAPMAPEAPRTPAPALRSVPPVDHGLASAAAQAAKVAPPMPPASPTPTAIPAADPADAGDVLPTLLGIIAEKTGYDTSELEPDFELEADLGIDTVKQAEVLSEITDRYGLATDDDFRLADHPTIEALASYVAGRMGAGAGAARAPEPARPASSVEPHLIETQSAPDRQDDGDDSDMDAPSVPSLPDPVHAAAATAPSAAPAGAVDVMATLLEVVAEKTGYDVSELEVDFELEADLGIDTVKQAEILADLRERFGFAQDDGFRLSDYPTIEALGGYLQTQVGAPALTEVPPFEGDDVETITPANRFAARPDEAPVRSPITPYALDPGPADVDPTLEPLPADTTPIPAISRGDVFPEDLDRHALSSASRRVVAEGTVPLPPSFRVRRPILVDRPARPAEQSLVDFQVLVLGESPTAHAVRQEISLRGGSLDGPYNTVVDVADDALTSFRQARFLDLDRPTRWLTVTRLGGMDPVDGHTAWTDGARAGFTKALGREWESTHAKVLDVAPDEGDLEVATAVCDELRTEGDTEVFLRAGRRQIVRYKTENPPPSSRLVGEPVFLITGGARGICARIALEFAQRGRVKLVLVGRSAVPEAAYDLNVEKANIKDALQKRGERPTPANIEKSLAPLRRANEAQANIEALRAHAGVEVTYEVCDLADPDATSALVRKVRQQHGTIDVCIHGAGVEESRLLREKDEGAWHRVFDGKAVGGRALIEALPEGTVFVSMGSVAGRFGNPGQVDYAAANDALARRCLAHPNALHIDWTAWDDVGMAADSAMKRILEERGVDLLPADAGAALLADLVAAEFRGELVVAGRLGDFQTDPGHPLLDRVEMDGDVVRGYREMSVASDPWLVDHSIDDTPVLPGVIGLELMAAVAGLVQPGSTYVGARDVKFEAPVKIHGDQTVLLVVEAEAIGPHEISARLIAVRALRTGRIRRQEHFSAVIQLGLAPEIDALPNAFLPDEVIPQGAIYERFFHGPIFQVLNTVFGVSQDGLIAEAAVEPDNIAASLVTGPLALEAAFQSAGLHRLITTHIMGLPMGIGRVQFIQPPEPGQTFSVTVRQVGEAYDIDVDALNTPLLRIREFTLAELGPIKPDDRFPQPSEDRPKAFPVPRLGKGEAGSGARADASEDPRPWLTSEELEGLVARGTEKRQRDRIAGRIAAKRALHALTGVSPLEIRVHTAESGEPVAEVPGWADVHVSLSHREGHAFAVAVRGSRVGVDLERIEPRSDSFARMWLSPEERELAAGPLEQTLIWAAKESVLKALGTGMAISPHHVRVDAIDDDVIRVSLEGDAAERLKGLGGGELRVAWCREDVDEVVVRVDLAA
ncbi:MAG: SDR family NAD(P)-dependent oxidoreductase [Myxococcota bacterium]